ncbi:hypothetical protein BC628DRAFT_1372055 [Trametes gibbosa]|nr:hypothetical protein BC628DRAFT_1372055 [Trametes gibbosa]
MSRTLDTNGSEPANLQVPYDILDQVQAGRLVVYSHALVGLSLCAPDAEGRELVVDALPGSCIRPGDAQYTSGIVFSACLLFEGTVSDALARSAACTLFALHECTHAVQLAPWTLSLPSTGETLWHTPASEWYACYQGPVGGSVFAGIAAVHAVR